MTGLLVLVIFEKTIYFAYFLNQDTSLNIQLKHLKFGIHIDSTHMEGKLSHIFHLCYSFHFMKSRTFICKKYQKVSRFFT